MTAITTKNCTHASDNATPCTRCGGTIKGYLHQSALGVWQVICWGCGHRTHFPGDDTDSGAEVRRMEAAHVGDVRRAL